MTEGLFLLRHAAGGVLSSKFPLTIGRLIVGRSINADVYLSDRSVSRRHAELEVTVNRVTVRDLNSRNGTFVDDQPVKEAVLRPRQKITFGSVELILSNNPLADADRIISEETADARGLARRANLTVELAGLTVAQRRVFDFLVAGMVEKRIARELGISQHTVHNHVRAIYRTFNVHTRAEFLVRVLPPVD